MTGPARRGVVGFCWGLLITVQLGEASLGDGPHPPGVRPVTRTVANRREQLALRDTPEAERSLTRRTVATAVSLQQDGRRGGWPRRVLVAVTVGQSISSPSWTWPTRSAALSYQAFTLEWA